jgi:hypothetical protein
LVGALSFLIFASAETQPWATENKAEEEKYEIEPLKV